MAANTRYYAGGTTTGPAQNKAEQWSNATQPTDPTPAGYTAWDAGGNVTTTRALTAAEVAQLAATDAGATATANQTTMQAQLQADLTVIHTWLTNNPTGAVLTAAQTRVLARLLANLTQFAIGSFAAAPVTS
jgi:hypothetical protein